MLIFESLLVLLVIAIVLLQLTRNLNVPYPTMLALAGVVIAASPWSPDFVLDPRLALALFIAPALLDAGFDLPPRLLLRHWLPIASLAVFAVVLSTGAVAWAAVSWMKIPLAVAIALGAIVAPPDAAAATAVLSRFELPRNTVTVLKGESLLNDAVALLIFSAAVSAAGRTEHVLPGWDVVLSVPGGLLAGYLSGRLFLAVSPLLAGTVSGTIAQFVATFGVWLAADGLHLSAILAVVAYAMTIARYAPERTSARDRVHAYSVWEVAVFLLNVLAFLLMGLQARSIVGRLAGHDLGKDLVFAAGIFVLTVVVRLAWVLVYNRLRHLYNRLAHGQSVPTLKQGLVVGWCGMRGLVTLAAALSLPIGFPYRDLLVLTAFSVVLGTLIGQGLTLGLLVRWLKFQPDGAYDEELSRARVEILKAGLKSLEGREDDAAKRLRDNYGSELKASSAGKHPRSTTAFDRLRRETIVHMRARLTDMRHQAVIDDDVFHALEQELDTSELAVTLPDDLEMVES